MKKYLNISVLYLVLGLVSGIFYREFTKANSFTDKTTLSVVHGHALTLGFLLFLIVLILEKVIEISKVKSFKVWLVFYNISLICALIALVFRGVLQVMGTDFAGLSHIAGLTHMMLAGGLVWFVGILFKAVK